MDIIRKYPKLKAEVDIHRFYTEDDFDKYTEIITNKLGDYEKWKKGINYKTGRKIKINGSTHRQLGFTFMIDKRYNAYTSVKIPFEQFNGIDKVSYLSDVVEKKAQNENIKEYNKTVCEIIREIEKLKKWNDYVIFENHCYGIPKIHNNFHRENDCNGNIKKTAIIIRECKGCRDGMPFNGTYTCGCDIVETMECEKCGYKE